MAGQFEKFVKILGTGVKPARFKGAPGNPDIVASVETNIPSKVDTSDGGGKQPKASRPSAVPLDSRPGGNNTRKRRSVSAPLPGATAPVPPAKFEAETKIDKTPEQREIEAGEYSFNRGEEAKGSTLRSLNGVTYDLNEYKASLPGKPSEAPAPYDISEFEPKKTTTPAAPAAPAKAVVKEGPNKSEDPMDYEQEPSFLKVKKIRARKGGKVYGDKIVDQIERESEGSTEYEYGSTLSEANKRTTIYKEDGSLKPEYDDPATIHSTTMHEHNGEIVEGGVHQAPYQKPPVAKTGNVIPQAALDTFGSQPVDRKQAAEENKRIRERRGTPTTTTVFDPNKISARPARGKTPERVAVLGAIREGRAAELASEGKTMTTVRPDIMATAKGLGRTDMYNLDEDYMNSTSFLAHEAVQKATVAHALGVHHTLGDPDNDHLHKYLGGKPLEAKSRLAAAYKVVDRNLRGNPEKVPGEFALLRGMVHAGSSPQQTLRAARGGRSNDVVINGQNVTLAEGSSENRQKIADTTTKITSQAEAAPKAVFGSVAATPTAPLAGTGRVAVRSVGQAPEESKIREFSPQELRNVETKVPTTDDSKRKVGPVEKEVEESSSIIDRLKKGPKLDESDK